MNLPFICVVPRRNHWLDIGKAGCETLGLGNGYPHGDAAACVIYDTMAVWDDTEHFGHMRLRLTNYAIIVSAYWRTTWGWW